MSSFFCCPLISCQYDSGHMKVVIHFDLRQVLVSMPYVLPGAVAGLHARSPPGQSQLWPPVGQTANHSESFLWGRAQPSASTVSGSCPVGWSEHKETLCLSRPQQSSMLLQNSHDLVKIITDPSFQSGRWRYCSNSELLFITSLLLANREPA